MMNRFLLVFSLGIICAACSKMDDKPGHANDSLLAKPMATEPAPPIITKDTSSGLIIDQSSFRTPEHEALLQRFQPIDVARIYHAFREIRKPGITEDQINKFIKEKKITLDELKAILEEGDLHGWGKR
ncbi:MAG: hypothetical protein ACHQM6_02715 [Candidatus Kapaibacterium sp.]